MSDPNHNFATIVSCMDGRIQKPLRDFAIKKFVVTYVDAITDRGGLLRSLSEEKNETYLSNMIENIQVSLTSHKSKGIVIAGHKHCAGYPISDDQKKKEVLYAADLIRNSIPGVEVVPVFVSEDDPLWKVELL